MKFDLSEVVATPGALEDFGTALIAEPSCSSGLGRPGLLRPTAEREGPQDRRPPPQRLLDAGGETVVNHGRDRRFRSAALDVCTQAPGSLTPIVDRQLA